MICTHKHTDLETQVSKRGLSPLRVMHIARGTQEKRWDRHFKAMSLCCQILWSYLQTKSFLQISIQHHYGFIFERVLYILFPLLTFPFPLSPLSYHTTLNPLLHFHSTSVSFPPIPSPSAQEGCEDGGMEGTYVWKWSGRRDVRK